MTCGASPPRFVLVPMHEIEIGDETLWLIRDLVPMTGIIVVYGATQAGKTFVVFDLAMHVAMGLAYRGRRVEGGPVVYFVGESHRGFDRRCVAFRQEKLAAGEQPPFYRIAASMALVEDHHELIGSIRDALGEARPALVVIDTLAKTFRGSESSDDDMGAYYAAADVVHRAFGCAVLIVHHTGWDVSHMRGHSSLVGNIETSVAVSRGKDGIVKMFVEKQREGASEVAILSRLRVVEIGADRHGDPITSCVVDAVATTKMGVSSDLGTPPETPKKLGAIAATGLAELKKLDQPASLTTWRQAMQCAFSTKKNPREAARQARETLEDRRLIVVAGDSVTVTVSASDAP